MIKTADITDKQILTRCQPLCPIGVDELKPQTNVKNKDAIRGKLIDIYETKVWKASEFLA